MHRYRESKESLSSSLKHLAMIWPESHSNIDNVYCVSFYIMYIKAKTIFQPLETILNCVHGA